MPVDNKTEALLTALRKKTDAELDALLAAALKAKDDTEEGEDYVPAIMEVIGERENRNTVSQAELDAAWEDMKQRISAIEPADTGTAPAPAPAQSSSDKHARNMSKSSRLSRCCAAAAALLLVFCGTAYALGFNVFQAIADWTAQQFGFVSVGDHDVEDEGPFWGLRLMLEEICDIPGIPTWAPEGTIANQDIKIEDRSNRVVIQCGYEANGHEFTIRFVVYDSLSEDRTTTYQKEESDPQHYEAGGITHHLMDNGKQCSAAWSNDRLEGHIQGTLSLDDLEKMIDSIYAE